MYFLDELDNYRLYRRSVLLPIDEKNKKHNCAAFLLSPNIEGTKDIFRNSLLVNRYYNAFYTERAVLYYVNQENVIEEIVGDFVSDTISLYDDSDIQIQFNGYDHNISDVKSVLTKKWFKSKIDEFKINPKKIKEIPITILESRKDSTGNMIYVVPKYRYPKEFKSYENFCYFNALVWLFKQDNPEINDWLCYALALKESGVSSLYAKREWPFHYNLGIICRSLDLFEENNSRAAYISELIKGYNGLAKLEIIIDDMFSLLGKELGSSLKKSFYENSMPISDTTDIIFEDSSYNPLFKKTLMKNRIKTAKELKEFYDKIKDEFSDIKYTYNDINLYNRLNLFVDLSYYSNSFLLNTTTTKIKGAKAYLELVKRLLNDKRFEESYTKQTVIIPVNSWAKITNDDENMHLIGKHINPISCIFWCLSSNTGINLKDIFGDREVLFLGDSSFMKINFSKLDKLNKTLFLRNIRMIINNSMVLDPEAKIGTKATSSARAIKMSIVDNIEKSAKIKIDDISGEEPVGKNTTEEEDKKTAIVQTVKAATANQNNEDDAIDSIDQNKEDAERIKKLMSDLATNPDDRGSNISGARASRMLKLQNDFLDSEFEGKSMREIIKSNETESEAEVVKTVKLDIDSVNPEWKDMKFAATMGSYKLDDDIVRIFGSFYNKSNPLVVRELNKEDTSTSDDLIETYTCKYESAKGERFTLKLDIPKFVDNQYMILRGNRKNIPIQLFLMPILKTEENAVQIVSCYNKIFVRRFGTNSGKSNPVTDKLMKALDKEYKHIKTETGDNSKVCSKYELPIDYIDLASNYSKIETPRYTFLFNQDYIRSKYKIDDKNGLCFGIDKKTKEPIYFKPNPDQPIFFSYYLQMMIETSLSNTNERDVFIDNFNSAATAVRYCYSRASILGTNIPLVVICGLAEGLEKTMQKAKIKYSLSESRPKYDKATQDIIKFNDGYLLYNLDYSSCLLMNGLKQCATEEHSLTEINSRLMYLDFLDMFGGRIKADGLDNFQDCMVDPITREVLQHYKLPTDYVSILLYANFLLSDNKFTKHGDIRSTRRMRRMEQVASYMYEVLSKAYGAYSTGLKHGRNVGFSVKQSAVIDRLLVGNTTDDQSILNALGEYEAYYAVTPKGPSGMNSDRAYSLDKRSFDDSMVNVLSASTGFAGNVGISRQATIDANIEGSRGYIYNDPDMENGEINSVKTLCMTESLTPFTTTRDDPMRLAMGFIQTSKHGMRCNHSDPALITSGADEALPYLISNTFAYKAKENGKVVEIVPDEYMIIEYDKPVDGKSHEYIDLSESVQKNSSSGFYVTLKLDTELKEGKRFKAGDIVAYDKQSFSDEMGADDNIAYNIGTLAKFAILNTDEGFEDSAIISNSLSEAMASDVVLEKEITIPKAANVYNLVKKGQEIHEGDTLMILQNAYDEEDVNMLLKNLAGSEDEITDLGRIPIKSKVTGVVQDIIIERTVEIDELSPTLKKVVNSYENDIKRKKKAMAQYGIEDENKTLPDTKAMPATGKLKNAYDSVVIRIYLMYHDKFKVGDKLIYGTAVKGVDKDVFPEGLEPYSEYRKDEKIHALLSIGSINARMVTSVLITTAINKGLIELSRKVKDMAGIPYDDNLI
jgi:hypothetical protein